MVFLIFMVVFYYYFSMYYEQLWGPHCGSKGSVKIVSNNINKAQILLIFCSADSPLLWIRIDPDMSVLRKVEFEQADFMWQYQLRYERDVVAQEESILALQKFPTPASRLALTDILEQEQCFYRVRIMACFCLAKVRDGHAGLALQECSVLSVSRNLYSKSLELDSL